MSMDHFTDDHRGEDLQAARDLIEKGWCQGGLSDAAGSYCALGAINKAVSGDVYEVTSRTAAAAGVLSDILDGSIAEFNNDPNTTHEDVLNLFDKGLAELGMLA